MEHLLVTVERAADGTYDVFTENSIFSGVGDTVEEAVADMKFQIEDYRVNAKEDNRLYPAWLEANDYDFTYRFDVPSLLQSYEGIVNQAALSKLTGINAKQLWKYAHGVSKPRPAQIKKIEDALHRIGKELSTISLTEFKG